VKIKIGLFMSLPFAKDKPGTPADNPPRQRIFGISMEVRFGVAGVRYRLMRSGLHTTQGRSPTDCEWRVCRVSDLSLPQTHSSDRVEPFKKPSILTIMQRFLKFYSSSTN
jgi:hypothetical protein